MSPSIKRAVQARARQRCEYCRSPQSESRLPFPVDHVVAEQHQGLSELDNLALACPSCNSHKGPNSAGFDPASGQHARLYNPRIDSWYEHFRWEGVAIVGLTPMGRATIVVLAMNSENQLSFRRNLVRSGWFFRADL
jgi:hypothetical protein